MLAGAATNVLLFIYFGFFLVFFVEGYEVPREFKGELIGGWLVSHNTGCFFCQTGKTFLARNWKDFSGAQGFGSPRQNVRYGGQLHHRATVRGRGLAISKQYVIF